MDALFFALVAICWLGVFFSIMHMLIDRPSYKWWLPVLATTFGCLSYGLFEAEERMRSYWEPYVEVRMINDRLPTATDVAVAATEQGAQVTTTAIAGNTCTVLFKKWKSRAFINVTLRDEVTYQGTCEEAKPAIATRVEVLRQKTEYATFGN